MKGKVDLKEARTWDEKTLDTKVLEIKKNIFEMRMQKAASGIEKPHELKVLKKDIARLLTLKKEKTFNQRV